MTATNTFHLHLSVSPPLPLSKLLWLSIIYSFFPIHCSKQINCIIFSLFSTVFQLYFLFPSTLTFTVMLFLITFFILVKPTITITQCFFYEYDDDCDAYRQLFFRLRFFVHYLNCCWFRCNEQNKPYYFYLLSLSTSIAITTNPSAPVQTVRVIVTWNQPF